MVRTVYGSVLERTNVPVVFTPLMVIRAIENKVGGKEVFFSHDWEPIENISTNLQKAVIASEDGTFLKHNGFDFVATGHYAQVIEISSANEKQNKIIESVRMNLVILTGPACNSNFREKKIKRLNLSATY